jgi:hypothetical protein
MWAGVRKALGVETLGFRMLGVDGCLPFPSIPDRIFTSADFAAAWFIVCAWFLCFRQLPISEQRNETDSDNDGFYLGIR